MSRRRIVVDCTVLLFGPAAQAFGADRVKLVLDGPATARAVLDSLIQACDALGPMVRAGRLAVNGRFAAGDQPIEPTDELALISMVSGG